MADRKQLDECAKDLWDLLKPDQPISPKWTDEILIEKIKEAVSLIAAGDELNDSSFTVLTELGVTIPAGVTNRDKEETEVSEKEATKKANKVVEKAAPAKKAVEKAAPAKKEAKPAKEKKSTTVERDEHGFKIGSFANKALAVLKGNKSTMADVKTAVGDTCYDALKKLKDKGYTVTKSDKGVISIKKPAV